MSSDRDTIPPPPPDTLPPDNPIPEPAGRISLADVGDVTLADIFSRLACLTDIQAMVTLASRDTSFMRGQMHSLGTALADLRRDVQDLADRIRALENIDAHYEARLATLERRMAALEKRSA